MNASRVLRVATYSGSNYPHNLEPCAMHDITPRPGCRMPGMHVEMLFAVLQSLAIPYELVYLTSEHGFGYYREGLWRQGLFGALQNGSIDTLAKAMVATNHRRLSFSFSYPIYDQQLVFVTAGPKKTLAANAGLLFNVFESYIWLILIVFSALYALSQLFLKHGHLSHTHWFKIISTILGFGALLFINLYADNLLAQLLHPVSTYEVRDVHHMIELIEKKRIQLVTGSTRGGMRDETVRTSLHPFFKRLRLALAKNPMIYEASIEKQMSMVKNGGHVAIATDRYKELYKKYNCDIRFIGKHAALPKYQVGFMVRPGFELLEDIDRALVGLQGHNENLYKRYSDLMGEFVQCDSGSHHRHKALDVVSLAGAFIVLLVASTFCVLCLVAEWCAVRYANRFGGMRQPDLKGWNEEKTEGKKNHAVQTDGEQQLANGEILDLIEKCEQNLTRDQTEEVKVLLVEMKKKLQVS